MFVLNHLPISVVVWGLVFILQRPDEDQLATQPLLSICVIQWLTLPPPPAFPEQAQSRTHATVQ
jgi:hypothetical protein